MVDSTDRLIYSSDERALRGLIDQSLKLEYILFGHIRNILLFGHIRNILSFYLVMYYFSDEANKKLAI